MSKGNPINITASDNSLLIKPLFDRYVNLNLPISELDDLTRNLKSAVFKLADDFDKKRSMEKLR